MSNGVRHFAFGRIAQRHALSHLVWIHPTTIILNTEIQHYHQWYLLPVTNPSMSSVTMVYVVYFFFQKGGNRLDQDVSSWLFTAGSMGLSKVLGQYRFELIDTLKQASWLEFHQVQIAWLLKILRLGQVQVEV